MCVFVDLSFALIFADLKERSKTKKKHKQTTNTKTHMKTLGSALHFPIKGNVFF